MKIGIFGGSFNPIHNGHLIIAEFIREYANLEKVFFVPVGKPTHREDNLESGTRRIEMIKLAIDNNNKFDVLDIEIKSGKDNYTIDTLRELKKLYPYDEICEIIGEDSAVYIEKWKEYKELLKMCLIYVFKRAGYNYKQNYDNIILVDTPYIEISSTEVRKRVHENKSIKYMIPEKVEEYIQKNKLYK